VQVNNNSAGFPFNNFVGFNMIGGNLQCAGNTPSPPGVSGGNNTVAGHKLGQCAGL
jgi:hypothetical protein